MEHDEFPEMEICHPHNLNRQSTTEKPFGIRVRLPAGDTFGRLLGADWEQFHWFASRAERDAALKDMASEHCYSRQGDRPHLIHEAVQAPGTPNDPFV